MASHVEKASECKPCSGFCGFATRSFVCILIGLAAAWVLPYILGEEFAVRMAARIYSPLVGYFRGDEGRDKVSVLLIDDRSLKNSEQTWPASYGYYARILNALVLYRPKAVFIDVVFASKRDDASIGQLTEAVCKAHDAGTRVYLAARQSETGSFVLRPELQALVPRCIQPVAIEYDPDGLDQIAWNYRLIPERSADGTKISSVAATIYRDMGGELPEHGHGSLALNWGYTPAVRGVEWLVPKAPPAHGTDESSTEHGASHGESGEMAYESYCRQPGNPLIETLPPALRSHVYPDAFKPFCVFQNTLYPPDLVTTSEQEERDLGLQLRDRVVMVGTALQGSNDRVMSPLHGNIPGVFMHAAALDNLLHYGDDYKRNTHLGWKGDSKRVLGLLLVGFCVMVGMNMLGEKLKEKFLSTPENATSVGQRRFRSARNKLVTRTSSLVFYTAFFTFMVLLGQYAFDLGMLAVAHIALFAVLAEWLEWGEKLEEWWCGKKSEEHEHSH